MVIGTAFKADNFVFGIYASSVRLSWASFVRVGLVSSDPDFWFS
jgi:hypothetical protein